MKNRRKLEKILNEIKESKTKYVLDLVKQLYEQSEIFRGVVDETQLHEYTTREDVIVNDNGDIILHISFASNFTHRVIYVLTKDSEAAMFKYAHNTFYIISPKACKVPVEPDCVFATRTCYGFGSWGTTQYNSRCEQIAHSEGREQLGSCCD